MAANRRRGGSDFSDEFEYQESLPKEPVQSERPQVIPTPPDPPKMQEPPPQPQRVVNPIPAPAQPEPQRVVNPAPAPAQPEPQRVVNPAPAPAQPEPQRVVNPAPAPAQNTGTDDNGSNNKNKMLAIGLVALLVLGGGCFFMGKSGKPTTGNPPGKTDTKNAGTLTLKTSKGCKVYIDGKEMNGTRKVIYTLDNLSYGSHNYRIVSPIYEEKTGTLTVEKNGSPVEIKLDRVSTSGKAILEKDIKQFIKSFTSSASNDAGFVVDAFNDSSIITRHDKLRPVFKRRKTKSIEVSTGQLVSCDVRSDGQIYCKYEFQGVESFKDGGSINTNGSVEVYLKEDVGYSGPDLRVSKMDNFTAHLKKRR